MKYTSITYYPQTQHHRNEQRGCDNDNLTERTMENISPSPNRDNSDDYENIFANTQIYANTNVLTMSDYANSNCTIPRGRKPALPPKPSSQANTMKRSQSPVPIVTLAQSQHPNGEYSMNKDPAEMSLKERLALFEQSTQTMMRFTASPKIQAPSPPITLPKNPSSTPARATSNAAIVHTMTPSFEISKCECF